jgi:LacI family transcriptional regulator
MRPSIRQVAEKAGVSTVTVSNVLRGVPSRASEETRQRVLEAARSLEYIAVPPPVFQNRNARTNTIGVVPMHRVLAGCSLDSVTIEGLCTGVALGGHDLLIVLRGEAEWLANRQEMQFLDRRCDGFIFISPGVGEWETALELLVQHGIPTVVCYRRTVPEGVAWVDPDNEAIMRLALEHLTARGHSRIVYFTGPQPSLQGKERLANLSGARSSYDAVNRQAHFTQIMRELGHHEFSEQIMWLQDPDWRLTPEESLHLIEIGATAVITGDIMAVPLWAHVEAAGLRIPQDLSIISIDGQIPAAQRGLTSVGFDYDEVGRQAVQAWFQLQAGNPAEACCKVIPARLVERASVAPPRR